MLFQAFLARSSLRTLTYSLQPILLAATRRTMHASGATIRPCAEVVPVPMFSDNYAYILVDPKTNVAACVDPADPDKVLDAARLRSVTISGLLCTHRHNDHSGGNQGMSSLVPNLQVYGSAYEPIPALTHPLRDEDEFSLGSLKVRAMHTPCHTSGHLLFYVTGQTGAPILFCGDTLFIGGCGRFFEGDASQMVAAMKRIASLPDETLVYCGHEYTLQNLRFLHTADPNNPKIAKKLAWAKHQTDQGLPTVPSTIGDEKEYNLFMQTDDPQLQALLGTKDAITAMQLLRDKKNNF